jgi:hypothetical protein
MAIVITPPGTDVGTSVGGALKNWKVDLKQYESSINRFSRTVSFEKLSTDKIVDAFLTTYGISLKDTEKRHLVSFIASLPKELLVGSDAGETPVALLNSLNILSLLDSALAYAQSGGGGTSKEAKSAVKDLTSLKSKVRDGYIQQEKQYLYSQMGDTELETVSEENINNTAAQYVDSESYQPPVGRETSSPTPTNEDGTPIIDSVMPGGFALSELGASETWEDYLRARPDSSILNLIDMEMDDALTIDDFESWVTSGRPAQAAPKKNYWGQKLSQDTIISANSGDKKITWNARQAVNFIYELNEKGDTTKLREIQEMMFEAGYFRPETGLPIYGVLDQATTQAWNMWLTDAARENRSLKDHFFKTVQQNRDIRSGKLKIDPIKDPLAVTATFQSAAKDLLGRNLTDVELRLLSSKFDEWRREVLTYGLSRQDQPFDLDSRVNAYLSERNNDEIWAGQKMELDSFVKEWIRG